MCDIGTLPPLYGAPVHPFAQGVPVHVTHHYEAPIPVVTPAAEVEEQEEEYVELSGVDAHGVAIASAPTAGTETEAADLSPPEAVESEPVPAPVSCHCCSGSYRTCDT